MPEAYDNITLFACRSDKSRLTGDLQRNGMIRIGIDPDLPGHARGSEHSLSARVHEGEECGVIAKFRPDKRDADHRPIDNAAGRVRGSACYVLDVGEDQREGLPITHAAAGLAEANKLGLALLLGRHTQHAGTTDSLGPQSFEESIRVLGGFDDLTALEGHPLALKPAEYLG
jgi:hypothetical protein